VEIGESQVAMVSGKSVSVSRDGHEARDEDSEDEMKFSKTNGMAEVAENGDLMKLFEDIARRKMRIPTLRERKCDEYDFHDVAVWEIHDALKEAYRAGMEAGRKEKLG
jgi:cytochrome c peroxidase